MQVKRYPIALSFISLLTFFSLLAWGQNMDRNTPPAMTRDEQEQLQIRRENFGAGRQLLLDQGVPFDPDELLRPDWAARLKPVLDAMPEMSLSRYETAPLHGAYLADTVYLPEKVRLSGHTLILAHYVVFEGKNPVIQGNFDLHFFSAQPVVALETTLAQALHKNADRVNVKYGTRQVLPSFSLLPDSSHPNLGHKGPHKITLDVSAPQRNQEPGPSRKPEPRARNVSWSPWPSTVFPSQATKTCAVSCNNPGSPGSTGIPGARGDPGLAGADGGPQAPSGSCKPDQSDNGMDGEPGEAGGPGGSGTDGATGFAGGAAGNINVQIALNDLNQYVFLAVGGTGGQGGEGGQGGPGGNGGTGAQGGNGVPCGCNGGNGGAGGQGGGAGPGGKGGNGASGGPGGGGGNITGVYPFNGPVPETSVFGGQGGGPGQGGPGGPVGNPGSGGQPGLPATSCGVTASPGAFGRSGPTTATLGPGKPGQAQGATGPNGTVSLTPYGKVGGTGGGGGCDLHSPSDIESVVCQCNLGEPGCSPIIIDTEGQGFHLTPAAAGVTFDISGTGHPLRIAWTDAHFRNAFLALPGPDGLVHNGQELFGNFTPQPQSPHPNGFLALSQYDKPEKGGNGDGMIDERDQIFAQLRLWIDENHDGICQPAELHRLPELGVYSLALDYIESRRTDEWGNQFRYKARVNPGWRKDARDETASGNPGRWTYDVFFVAQ